MQKRGVDDLYIAAVDRTPSEPIGQFTLCNGYFVLANPEYADAEETPEKVDEKPMGDNKSSGDLVPKLGIPAGPEKHVIEHNVLDALKNLSGSEQIEALMRFVERLHELECVFDNAQKQCGVKPSRHHRYQHELITNVLRQYTQEPGMPEQVYKRIDAAACYVRSVRALSKRKCKRAREEEDAEDAEDAECVECERASKPPMQLEPGCDEWPPNLPHTWKVIKQYRKNGSASDKYFYPPMKELKQVRPDLKEKLLPKFKLRSMREVARFNEQLYNIQATKQ